MTDKILPDATILSPYFDDYDETNNFHRILFRPGYAVQGRELTQLQTILQKQVQRFGDSIFQNGSMVTGGEITFYGADSAIRHMNLSSSYTASSFNQKYVQSLTTLLGASAQAYVLTTDESNTTEPPTLIINPLNNFKFADGDTIYDINANTTSAIVATSSGGTASAVSINEGVYYYNGYFVRVAAQTIFLDKYDNTPTFSVGLQFSDSIVDEGSDSYLLDPALESSNYQAPGATLGACQTPPFAQQ